MVCQGQEARVLSKQEKSQVELSVESLLTGCTGKADALSYIETVIDEDFPGAPPQVRDALISEAKRYLDQA